MTPEQQSQVAMAQQMEQLLDIVVLGQTQNKPARDIAGYIMNKHEQAAMLLVPADPETLVGEVIQRRPALGTAAGTKFIREVHSALKGMVN